MIKVRFEAADIIHITADLQGTDFLRSIEMNSEIGHQIECVQTCEEEWEFKQKKADLIRLESKLAQAELELATFRCEIQNFRARYINAIGSRYSQLDRLEAEIAQIEAWQRPDDQSVRMKAEQARAQAEESERTSGNQREMDPKKISRFKPTESLKKLYRQIAKRIHPDLAVNEQERVCFQELMAKANQAYQDGDEIGLQSILRQWKKVSGLEKSDISIDKLTKVQRQIAQIKERLLAIEKEKAEIRNSSIYQLKHKVEKAESSGIDLLAEMARVLDHQIQITKAKLDQLVKGYGKSVS